MLSVKAEKIAKRKYYNKELKETSWEEVARRSSRGAVEAEFIWNDDPENYKFWYATFFDLIYNLDFIPGGRILSNAGTSITSWLNCFVIDVEDSITDIYEALGKVAIILKQGGGVGMNLSKLREEGARIEGTGGESSGVMSFSELFDLTADVVKQASRRGAMMLILDVDHPEIEKFIHYKSTLSEKNKHTFNYIKNSLGEEDQERLKSYLMNQQLTHFNISVNISDKFMEAVKQDLDWDLISPSSGEVVKTLKAKELFEEIAEHAWKSGDPGIVFMDRANEDNLVPYIDTIHSTNPCLVGTDKLLTIDGYQKLEDLAIFDKPIYATSVDQETRQWITQEVEVFKTKEVTDLLRLTTATRKEITCTPDHLVPLFNPQWSTHNDIKAQHLEVGDLVQELTSNKEIIYSHIIAIDVVTTSDPVSVYDFTVLDTVTHQRINHYGIVNGVLVHNCGEIPLTANEACVLGSINLVNFLVLNEAGGYEIDWFRLGEVSKVATRFLDNIVEMSHTGIDVVDEKVKGLRRLGLGIMGLADVLAYLEIPYGSLDSQYFSEKVAWVMTAHAWQESNALGKERGTFPLFDPDADNNWHVITKVTDMDKSEAVDPIQVTTPRNVSVSTIAPTGTTALLCDVNGGIEPFFALSYVRYVTEGDGDRIKERIVELNPIIFEKLLKYKIKKPDMDKITEYVLEHGSVQGCDLVPQNIKDVFRTANELNVEEHLRIQKGFQKYISNSISKTSNLPENATVEDVKNVYMYAYDSGLKGVTVYRDKSKNFQILNRK